MPPWMRRSTWPRGKARPRACLRQSAEHIQAPRALGVSGCVVGSSALQAAHMMSICATGIQYCAAAVSRLPSARRRAASRETPTARTWMLAARVSRGSAPIGSREERQSRERSRHRQSGEFISSNLLSADKLSCAAAMWRRNGGGARMVCSTGESLRMLFCSFANSDSSVSCPGLRFCDSSDRYLTSDPS